MLFALSQLLGGIHSVGVFCSQPTARWNSQCGCLLLSEEANRAAMSPMITPSEHHCCSMLHEQYQYVSASATLAFRKLATTAAFLSL